LSYAPRGCECQCNRALLESEPCPRHRHGRLSARSSSSSRSRSWASLPPPRRPSTAITVSSSWLWRQAPWRSGF